MMEDESLSAVLRDHRLRTLYAHWCEIRAGDLLPARTALDPVKIPGVLSIIFVCDYERESGRLRYRLAGEDILGLYPVPLRGRYQDEFLPPHLRPAHFARVKRFMSLPALVYAQGDVYGFNSKIGTGERLGLPLASDGRNADAVVGATVYHWRLAPPQEHAKTASLKPILWSVDGTMPIGDAVDLPS